MRQFESAKTGYSQVMRAPSLLLVMPVAFSFVAQAQEITFEQLLDSTDLALQTEWAVRYEHGEGLERDYDRAIQLYCSAAWDGDVEAQYQLGWLYANGRGLERNDQLAAGWFGLAAAQGDNHAARMLTRLDTTDNEHTPRCVRPNGEEVLRLPSSNSPNDVELTIRLVKRLAPRYGLEPELVLALIEVESNFDPNAHSPKDAQGLMQLIPPTALRFGVEDIKHPLQNLKGGMAYLRWLLDYFEGDLTLALAGYNAGEGAVERYNGIPPYAETQRYVKLVFRSYEKRVAKIGA